jgi:hypothetical protein
MSAFGGKADITATERNFYGFRKSSGRWAMLAAILLASSRVSNFAADLRPGSSA